MRAKSNPKMLVASVFVGSFPIISELGRKLAQIIDAELLLNIGDSVHHFFKPVISKQLMFLFLEILLCFPRPNAPEPPGRRFLPRVSNCSDNTGVLSSPCP